MDGVNGEFWTSDMLEALSPENVPAAEVVFEPESVPEDPATCYTCGKAVEVVGDPPQFCSEECRKAVEVPSGLLVEFFERIGKEHHLLPEEHGDRHPSDRQYHNVMPSGPVPFLIEQVA